MGQQLTVGPTTSMPRRLVALAGAVATVQHPGRSARYHLAPGFEMSALERSEAATWHASLTSALDPTAPFEIEDRMESGPVAKAHLVSQMIRGLGGQANPPKNVVDAKVSWYADAIEDLPAWAIAHAMKRWARAECPASVEEEPDYAFPPAPGVLRKLALSALDLPNRYRAMLERLLGTIPTKDALDPDWAPAGTAATPALRRM